MVAVDRSGCARGPDRCNYLHDPLASLGSEVKRYVPIRIAKDSVGYGFAENILDEQTVPEQLRNVVVVGPLDWASGFLELDGTIPSAEAIK